MAGWIKMPVGREVGPDPGSFVLDGDPAPCPQKGTDPLIFGPWILSPNSWMPQDATWYEGRGVPGHIVLRGDRAPPPQKRTQPPFSAHVYCCQTVAHSSYCWARYLYFSPIRQSHTPHMCVILQNSILNLNLTIPTKFFKHHTLCIASTYYVLALHTAF